ncbi:MAG: hypothetical protein ACUVQS_00825 [Candidatus Bipolaricaulaceae bacterium]
MMRRSLLLVVVVGLVSTWGFTPGLADAGLTGGAFLDVPKNHPAYSSVQNLLSRGILVTTASGQFMGDQPLLRYDAAVWLDRAIKNIEAKISATTDLTPRLSSLETQMRSLSSDLSTLRSDITTLSARVNALQQAVGQGGEVAQKAQMGVILGLTGVILGLAALAWVIFL